MGGKYYPPPQVAARFAVLPRLRCANGVSPASSFGSQAENSQNRGRAENPCFGGS